VESDRQLAPSVVCAVVVHDPGDWFDDTLAAFAAQDYPNFRVLFLITPSTPDAELHRLSQQIADRIPSAFVRTASTSDSFGVAANDILRLVEGDNGFFLLCHDDVAPAPDAVRIMVEELYRSNAGMVGPKLVEWDEPKRLQHVGLGLDRFGEVDPIVEPGEFDQEQHDAVRDVFVLPSACLLVRADLFRVLDGYDPAISFHGDDVELCWRAHLNGARVVVAPDARVRHRERLEERRPDLNHRQLGARHRMRAVATLTGASRLVGRSLQLLVLSMIEVVVGLFTGRLGEALSSLRALGGLVPRTSRLVARRREVAEQRQVPEREVLGLQIRGSARLTSYIRGRETTTYVGAETTVRRWRETSYAPLLAWFLVVAAIVIGSRTFIDRGVPRVGEFLPFPDSARDLFALYGSGWDPRSFGATSPAPTGWVVLGGVGALTLSHMALAMTMSIIGLFFVGALGAWRLATVFPATRARITAMVVYVGTPLVPGLMATGDASALIWYAALPWMVHLARRVAAVDTADPELAPTDLVDGIAPTTMRDRIRYSAMLSLVVAVAAAFVPVVIVMWLVVGLVIALATLLARGSAHTAGWFAGATVVSVAVAVVLNLPWSSTWSWSTMVPPPLSGPRATGLVDIAMLSVDERTFAVLALALYLPFLAALAITRAWRLTWAIRSAGLVLVFGSVAVLGDRNALPFEAPALALLLAPVVLGLSISCAAIAGGFGEDVLGRGFGWRQPLALAASAAIVVGLVPAAISIGDGGWGSPRTTLPGLLQAQLPPADAGEGGYRVLFVGDPRVLPVPGVDYRSGIAYAIADDGELGFTERWSPPSTAADDTVTAALDRIADGSTLRAGRLLAPLGVRFIVVPEIDGASSTVTSPIPLPVGLLDSIADQLDFGAVFGAPNVHVFVNRSWFPTTAQLTGPTAQASELIGQGALVRSDLSAAEPLFPGASHLEPSTDDAVAGVVHLGVPFDDRWELTVDGERLAPRPGFGLTTAYDVAAPGEATLTYRSPASRVLLLVLQVLVLLVVLVAATRATLPIGRRLGADVDDETLIDLDETTYHDPVLLAPSGGDAPAAGDGEIR
jgi:GT2 family glycosyltransferase